MTDVFGDMPRNEDGQLVFGNEGQGCRHCGRVEMKVSADGSLVLYHPGVECCLDAINDQIRYREGEITLREQRVAQLLEGLRQRRETAEAYGNSQVAAAAESRQKLAKAERGIGYQVQALEDEKRELVSELADLKRKRARA